MINVEKAINDLKRGKFVVIRDSNNRENEADLTIAAKFVNKKKLTFLLKYTCGQVCVPMSLKTSKKLGLKLMTKIPKNDKRSCNFTIPVDSKEGGTGISAHDKYLTIKNLVNYEKDKLKTPGHTFPVTARDNGVFERQGHSEACFDLIRFSKIDPEIAVICELMNRRQGKPLRGKQLEEFSNRYKIPIVEVNDIANYRKQNE